MEGNRAQVHFHNTSVGCDHPPQPLRYLGLLRAVFQDMPQSPDVGFDVGLGVLVT